MNPLTVIGLLGGAVLLYTLARPAPRTDVQPVNYSESDLGSTEANPYVATMQRQLTVMGYNPGGHPADGSFGTYWLQQAHAFYADGWNVVNISRTVLDALPGTQPATTREELRAGQRALYTFTRNVDNAYRNGFTLPRR